jgi:V-type H+-transporting ATPase subunit G
MAASALNSGIQVLLKAEKEAADTVKAAREFRSNRLKEAKLAANAAIEQFKKSLEEEFKHSVGKDGTTEEYAQQLRVQTDKDIKEIDAAYNAKKDTVIDLLLGVVTTVKIEVAPDYADSLKALNTAA